MKHNNENIAEFQLNEIKFVVNSIKVKNKRIFQNQNIFIAKLIMFF